MNKYRIREVVEKAIDNDMPMGFGHLHYTVFEAKSKHCTLGLLHLETHSGNEQAAVRCMRMNDRAQWQAWSCGFLDKFDLTQEEANQIAEKNDFVSVFQTIGYTMSLKRPLHPGESFQCMLPMFETEK